jgi:hypothetical protein
MANMTITVGRMLCGKVRLFLDQCKFKGMDVDYLESSGWVERDFTIKGSDKDVLSVHASLKDWSDNLDT